MLSSFLPLTISPTLPLLSTNDNRLPIVLKDVSENLLQIPINERTFPNTDIQHPFVCLQDFLEEKMLAFVFDIEDTMFHTCYQSGRHCPYLLPIKRFYFDYFSVEDLRKNFSMKQINENQIKVTLWIPVQNNEKVRLEKIYHVETLYQQPTRPNELQMLKMNLAIYPFYQLTDVYNRYVVMALDKNTDDWQLSFFAAEQGNNALPTHITSRTPKDLPHQPNSIFYELSHIFDCIAIHSDEASGLLLPNWSGRQFATSKGKQMNVDFCIDISDAATHICWTSDLDTIVRDFELNKDEQVCIAVNPLGEFGHFPESNNCIHREFFPLLLADKNSPYSFPIPTSLYEHKDYILSKDAYSPATNIVFAYTDAPRKTTQTHKYELDFVSAALSDDENAKKRFLQYLIALLALTKSKAVMTAKVPFKPNIVYFSPIYLSRTSKSKLRNIWELAAKQVFGKKATLSEKSSDLATYYYARLHKKVEIYSFQNTLTISLQKSPHEGDMSHFSLVLPRQKRALSCYFYAPLAIFDAKNTEFYDFLEDILTAFDFQYHTKLSAALHSPFLAETIEKNKDFASFFLANINLHPLRLAVLMHYAALIFWIIKVLELSENELQKIDNIILYSADFFHNHFLKTLDLPRITPLLVSVFSAQKLQNKHTFRLANDATSKARGHFEEEKEENPFDIHAISSLTLLYENVEEFEGYTKIHTQAKAKSLSLYQELLTILTTNANIQSMLASLSLSFNSNDVKQHLDAAAQNYDDSLSKWKDTAANYNHYGMTPFFFCL